MEYIDTLGKLSNNFLRITFLKFWISYNLQKQMYKVYCYEPLERELIRRCVAGL